MPSGAGNGARQASGDRGDGRHLIVVDMRALLADHFHAGTRPGFDREQIAHRAGRNKESRFALENLRGALLAGG